MSKQLDPIWDELSTLFGWTSPTPSERKLRNALVRDLKAKGATPDSIRAAYDAYPKVMPPGCMRTAPALVKHWDQLQHHLRVAANVKAKIREEIRKADEKTAAEVAKRDRLFEQLRRIPVEERGRCLEIARERMRGRGSDVSSETRQGVSKSYIHQGIVPSAAESWNPYRIFR